MNMSRKKVLLPRQFEQLCQARVLRNGKKPSAFIDCDGVLRDTFRYGIKMYEEYYDVSLSPAELEIKNYRMSKIVPADIFSEFFPEKGIGKHTQEVFENAPLLEDDIHSSLEKLSQTHDLYLVSAQLEGWEHFTVNFLDKHNLSHHFKEIYFAPLVGSHGLKEQVYRSVGFNKMSFVIEDSPENLLDAKNIFLRAIAYEQSYNKIWVGERTASLKKLVSCIDECGYLPPLNNSKQLYWQK